MIKLLYIKQNRRISGQDICFGKIYDMSIFSRKSSGGIKYLIVGLGNPDKKYRNTRHNTGFIAVDFIAGELQTEINRKKFDSLTAEATVSGEKVLLMKPQTYMNLSGTAVLKAANFYKIPPENIIIIFDDISLDVGKLRIRRKGSHGGHNGIRSIVDYLSSENFPRIKIGIGERPNPNYDLADWVLSVFKEDELNKIKEVSKNCIDIVKLMIEGKIDKAMSKYNS